MTHQSIWQQTSALESNFDAIKENLTVDIAIVGAGITGLTAAYELRKTGKKIAVFEAHGLGENTTALSTANLYIPVQDSYSKIKKKFGLDAVKKIIAGRKLAIDHIENICIAEKIDCKFTRRPMFIFSNDDKNAKLIAAEKKTLIDAGLHLEEITDLPFHFKWKEGFKLNNQARFNPYIYLISLAHILKKNNVQIFAHSAITAMQEKNEGVLLHSNEWQINARKVLITTHLPIGINKTHFLAYPYRSYAVAFACKDQPIPNGIYWNKDLPYQSISTHNVKGDAIDTIVIAGNSHKTGKSKEKNHDLHYQKIRDFIGGQFKNAEITQEWSAQHYQSADALPYIGPSSLLSKNKFIATGFHADGLVYGTLSGILLADIIRGKKNEFAKYFSSKRMSFSLKFIKENLSVAYDFFKGYFSILSAKKIPLAPGDGQIIKIDGKTCAAYRDEAENLHCVSPICTHMACVVKWNDAEKTWDCPCHGSRFGIDGEVLEGPALSPLKKMDVKAR